MGEAAQVLGIGKTLTWRMVWDGRLRSISIGGGNGRAGRVLIPRQVVADFLAVSNQRDEQ